MIKLKDGFVGERSIVLPPMVVDMERTDPVVSNLYITDIGYYPHADHHYRRREQAINQYVLIYCVDGSGWYRIDEKEYKVRKNQFFILPSGKPALQFVVVAPLPCYHAISRAISTCCQEGRWRGYQYC